MKIHEEFEDTLEFEWDRGNDSKNLRTHDVTNQEAEEVFANEPLILLKDVKHSKIENRYSAFGTTHMGRKLLVVFTLRGRKIRVISARDMNKKERNWYYDYQEKDSAET